MKVEFIKPGAKRGLAYFVGDVAEFEDKQANDLIETGFCKKIDSVETEEPKKPAKKK